MTYLLGFGAMRVLGHISSTGWRLQDPRTNNKTDFANVEVYEKQLSSSPWGSTWQVLHLTMRTIY